MTQHQKFRALRIGLTGGIASGKSSAARAFKALGIDVISADDIAKDVLKKNSPALKQVVQQFGQNILNKDLELDRKRLRDIIFKDVKQRKILNSITHPEIRKEMVRMAQASTSPYVILEIPLLIESNLESLVNRVLVITTELDTQITRITNRDNCSVEQALSIIKAQTTNEVRLQHADDCINNSGALNKLNNQVLLLHNKYLDLISNSNNSNLSQLNKNYGLDLH